MGPANVSTVSLTHSELGEFIFSCEGTVPLLFTENETNHERLFGHPNESPYVKDGINDFIVLGDEQAVNPESRNKAAAHYALSIEPGMSSCIRLRLTKSSGGSQQLPFGNPSRRFSLKGCVKQMNFTDSSPPHL
jgi:hypothetical protein